MRENYKKWLSDIIKKNSDLGIKPRLLLHCCCAPCSSYVFEYLNEHFDITAYFYNPNISDKEEYLYRADELKRLILEMGLKGLVKLNIQDYDNIRFLTMAQGKESLAEGGLRCYECYRLRLGKAAAEARLGGFDYFSTTLSVSPHKNAKWLNKIGEMLEKQCGAAYLYSDFKKKDGYKRSCDLSRQYGLYRQSFCGCKFSKIKD